MIRNDLSPVHKMVLHLAHTYGSVSFGTSVQTMWVEGSGCAIVYGCGRTQSTLLRDGYVVPETDENSGRFVLTDKGLARVQAFRSTPRLVATAQRTEPMTWLTDKQWAEVEKWIPANNHGGGCTHAGQSVCQCGCPRHPARSGMAAGGSLRQPVCHQESLAQVVRPGRDGQRAGALV